MDHIEPLFDDLVEEARVSAFPARYAGARTALKGKTGRLWYSRLCGCWLFATTGTADTTTIYRNAVAVPPPRSRQPI